MKNCSIVRMFECSIAGAAGCLIAGCATTATVASAPAGDPGKNVYNVRFGALPGDCERLLADDPESWDFNFRPYGRTADLVSDPAIVRDVAAGKQVAGRPTGLRVSCDEDGWSFLVFCAEPDVGAALEKGESLPLPNLEMYFLPGDTDNTAPATYWQFYKGEGCFDQYDWPVCDRHWRALKPYVKESTRTVKNGYVFRMDIPWEALWDKMPLFSDRTDNFWRLTVIRWTDGGVTWGGGVHEPALFGYIRWPDFTDAQRTEIMKRVLHKGWESFRCVLKRPAFAPGGGVDLPNRPAYVRTEPYAVAKQAAEGPRSFINYTEDPAFRPTLDRLTAEAQALAPEIARFDGLSRAEQEALYRRASAKLFNFKMDVEEAYEKHLRDKFVK